jgi:aryl-alcohol dehydrogenase-like predicted oxidoreductase
MEYRAFGRTGVKVSPFCVGTMNFGGPTSEAESLKIVRRAVEGGINFFDTANVYQRGESEVILGKALREVAERDSVFLATKVYNTMGEDPNARGVSRYHIMNQCEASLRRLQVDHIDLYQLHRNDSAVPLDETLRALDDLVRSGKVRYIGCSTFPPWRTAEGIGISERLGLARFVSEQPPYNILDRRIENELVPMAQWLDLAIIPYSPMAGGVLAAKYSVDGPPPDGSRLAQGSPIWVERSARPGRIVAGRVEEYAKKKGLSAAQFSLLWIKDQPGITSPIVGPRTLEHLDVALSVIDESLTAEDAAFVDTLVPPGTAVNNFHNTSNWMKERVGWVVE